MINTFFLDRTHVMDFFQIMTNVKTFLSQEDLTALKLEEVHTDFSTALLQMEDALKPLRKTGLTEPLYLLDEKRDTLLVGLASIIKAHGLHPQPEFVEAANRVKVILTKYGKKPQNLPLREETAMISSLLKDLQEASLLADIQKVSANAWIQALQTTNNEFENLYNDRTKIEAGVIAGKTKSTRSDLQNAFTKLVKTINALSFINGEAPYQRLADNINREIERALINLKQRSSRTTDDNKEAIS